MHWFVLRMGGFETVEPWHLPTTATVGGHQRILVPVVGSLFAPVGAELEGGNLDGQLRLLSTADSVKRYLVALSPTVGETGTYGDAAQACSLTNATLKPIVGYLEAVATLQVMMS